MHREVDTGAQPALIGTTLSYIVAIPPTQRDAGVAIFTINFATPKTKNPRGVGTVMLQGENRYFLVPEKKK